MEWLHLQLADSAFPSGGFAHAAGLEVAVHLGVVKGPASVEKFVAESLWHTGRGGLIFASAAHRHEETVTNLDDLCDAFLSSQVANQASRIQGRTFLSTVEQSFLCSEISSLKTRLRRERAYFHHAPIFGSVLQLLRVNVDTMQRLLLYVQLRGIISAAVRLGVLGPYQGQQIIATMATVLDQVLAECRGLGISALAQSTPLLEMYQSQQGRLYSKLFLS